MREVSLFQRLGGYDVVAAVAGELLSRLMTDSQLGRFWEHRGADGVQREKQLFIEFLASSAGGPVFYSGRDMESTHQGMHISRQDWTLFIDHLNSTLDKFDVATTERKDLLGFIDRLKVEIVE